MKYLDEFRDPELARQLIEQIRNLSPNKRLRFMEVCGSHTVAICKSGIRELLPDLELISGPGCPVCVTSTADLDRVIHLSQKKGAIITTFGDMVRVPGSRSSLMEEMSQGARVQIVYSPFDALKLAKYNPDDKIVFLGVGFETTSPTIAATILQAEKSGVSNFFILSYHKLIPPAMKALLEAGEGVALDGFICPGHVSTIIGMEPYQFIAREHHLPAVITGFEPLDILYSLYLMVKQVKENRAAVEIQYSRVVRPEGNPLAMQKLKEVFKPCEAEWRGLGIIPESGLALAPGFKHYDAALEFDLPIEPAKDPIGCECGNILKGLKSPLDCPLFGGICNPAHPVGPCMVSSEGSCAAFYKYNWKKPF